VVARRQLLALGLSSEAIQHRVRRGRLHPVLRPARGLRGGPATIDATWALDGGRVELRLGRCPEPLQRCCPVGNPAGGRDGYRSLGARSPRPPPAGHRRSPQAHAEARRRNAEALHSGNHPYLHSVGHCRDPGPRSARGCDQRGRHARPDRSRDAAFDRRRAASPSRRREPAGGARSPHVHPDRLGARAPVPADRPPRRPPAAADSAIHQRGSRWTSTGPRSAWSWRRTGCAITAPRPSRPEIACATRPTSQQAERACGLPTPRWNSSQGMWRRRWRP
jgi:hypothetical protein